jgi:hypothetical protein
MLENIYFLLCILFSCLSISVFLSFLWINPALLGLPNEPIPPSSVIYHDHRKELDPDQGASK